jgi:ribulose-5-phosphate 4-epimerase/fuculose-1-phosphate aldolase
MTHAELIEDLVAANQILSHRRIFDAYGHISARDPRHPQRYWLTRSMPPADVTADDIIEFDLDNKPIRTGENRLFFERVIHGEVYKARPERDVSVPQSFAGPHSVLQQRHAAAADGGQCRVPGRGRAGVRYPYR